MMMYERIRSARRCMVMDDGRVERLTENNVIHGFIVNIL